MVKLLLDVTMRWHLSGLFVGLVPYASYKLGVAYPPASLPAFIYPRMQCDLAYLQRYGGLDPDRFISSLFNREIVAIILGLGVAFFLAVHWHTYRRQFPERLERTKPRAELLFCAGCAILVAAYITLAAMPSSKAWGSNCSMFADPGKWSRRHALAPHEGVFLMIGIMTYTLYLAPAVLVTCFKLSREKAADRAKKNGKRGSSAL